MDARERGRLGEEEAARRLCAKGYSILQANYRTRFGEIDMIAADSTYIVFVEVKTRTENPLYPPREAVTAGKQKRIRLAAEEYLATEGSSLQPRFDVVEVITARGEKFRVLSVCHLENAFT